jgi:hypothetical protein
VRASERHRPGPAPALAGVSGAALCLIALVVSARTLPFPELTDVDGLTRWARTVGAATAAFTGLRAVAVVLLGWWVLTWVIGVAARRTHRPRVVAAVDRVSPRFVRHLAEAAAGLGIVVAALSPAMGAGAAQPGGAVVTMVDLGPVMNDLGGVEVSDPPTVALAPSTQISAPPAMTAEAPATGPAEPTTSGTWTVEPGDTLWHVAEVTAAESLGRPPGTAEVARRLDELVALNAERLAVPGDPSLVFPGQTFLLD